MVKNIIIIILIIVVVILGYMLMVSFPNKAKAECESNLTAAVQTQVASAVQQCQQALQQVMQVPACASALSQ